MLRTDQEHRRYGRAPGWYTRRAVVSEADLAVAAERMLAYVETAGTAPASVMPRSAARRGHSHGAFGQNPANQAQAAAAPSPDAAATA